MRKWPATEPGPPPSPRRPRAQRAGAPTACPTPASAGSARAQVPPGRRSPSAGSAGARVRSHPAGPLTWPRPRCGCRLWGPARSRPPSWLWALPAAHALRRGRRYFCFGRGRAPRDSSGAAPRAPARPTPGPQLRAPPAPRPPWGRTRPGTPPPPAEKETEAAGGDRPAPPHLQGGEKTSR